MVFRRVDNERFEHERLMPYAQKSGLSLGRTFPEPETEFRTCFQRDIDRIVHSKAFRRLEYKTQVFVNDEGDHYRTRLTHTFEVAQVAEAISRTLGLNIDLTRAIALAHDLGHTPFGHAGESILNELTSDIGGFEHNRQSLRVVEKLETLYPTFSGLNLSWEVREGLIKHKSVYDNPQSTEYHPETLPTLEAQVVNLADELAYNCHDVEDALRAGIIHYRDLEILDIWKLATEHVPSHLEPEAVRRYQSVRSLKNLLVENLVYGSARLLENSGIESVDEARQCKEPLISFSESFSKMCSDLSAFLYRNFYFHYRIVRMTTKAKMFLKNLFNYYMEQPLLLPAKVQERFKVCEAGRVICDYIAGMTDRFALDEYRKLLDPNTRV